MRSAFFHPADRARRAASFALCWMSIGAGSVLPAQASVIVNKGASPFTITIEESGTRQTHEIVAGGQLDSVCLKGCIVILDGIEDGAYRLPEGNEIVSIEERVLYYEGAVEPAAKPD